MRADRPKPTKLRCFVPGCETTHEYISLLLYALHLMFEDLIAKKNLAAICSHNTASGTATLVAVHLALRMIKLNTYTIVSITACLGFAMPQKSLTRKPPGPSETNTEGSLIAQPLEESKITYD